MLINYTGDSKVIKRICELINTMTGVNFEVVQTLPTVDISTSTIYLLPKQDPASENIYDEYINTDGTSQGWELIGTTEIDLTNYVQFSDLSTVATSGDYDDLIDKPTIPTVNDGTLTIQLNGTTEQTFTANSSSDKTANIKAVDWVSNGKLGTKNLNLYPYTQTSRTDNGVTFTVNADGSISTSGTASATTNATFVCHSRAQHSIQELVVPNGKYIISGCPSGGATNKYYIGLGRTHNNAFDSIAIDSGSGAEFTLNGDDFSNDEVVLQIAITIYRGNNANGLTFRPMLRLAEDSDNTWQPYAQTNQELTKDIKEKSDWFSNGILGAKNLNSTPYTFGSPYTNNGVTYTVNADGSISLSGGTNSTQTSSYVCHSRLTNGGNALYPLYLPNGTYIFSGCPSGGNDATKYSLRIAIRNADDTDTVYYDEGNGVKVTLNGDKYNNDKVRVQIYPFIRPNQNVTGFVFKPMVRVASDTDDTFQPYAMTNQQLTEVVKGVPSNSGTYTLQATRDANGNITYSWV